MAAPSLNWCPSQVLVTHNLYFRGALIQYSPGKPNLLLGRRDSTPTPGLREQQGPPWDGAPRAFSLRQGVLLGHGPKGQEDCRAPLPLGLSADPYHQAQTDWGPFPLQSSLASFILLQIGNPHLKSWGVSAQTLGFPVSESPLSISLSPSSL